MLVNDAMLSHFKAEVRHRALVIKSRRRFFDNHDNVFTFDEMREFRELRIEEQEIAYWMKKLDISLESDLILRLKPQPAYA
jgi:hypothetical protein